MKVDLMILITIISAISGVALGWIAKLKSAKTDIEKRATKDATISVDVEYIKKNVDRILQLLGNLNSVITAIDCRLIEVETNMNKVVMSRLEKLEEKMEKRLSS